MDDIAPSNERASPSPSSSSQSSAKAPFPFGYVILTFPDEKAARAASGGPLEHLRSCYPGISILASCDPYNCRVGSGGGTLNALEEVLDAMDKSQWKDHFYSNHDEAEEKEKSILILHAGGASSRCPSQMVLGKAWTSLPCGGYLQKELQNPLLLWFRLAHVMFQNITRGSLVVIASDTILDMPELSSQVESQIDELFWKSAPSSSVIALAVPASLQVAKNHGVFVPNILDAEERVTTRMISPCFQVFQKPSLHVLEEQCAFSLESTNEENQVQKDKAWIDTGVVCFLPPAAQVLKNLVQQPSSCELLRCTKRGLEMAWKKEHNSSSSLADHKDADQIMQEFSPSKAQSIDLYTHFMNALHLSISHTTTGMDYCASFKGQLDEDVALLIYGALSSVKLLVWTEPRGSFLHMGTTRELMQFLLAGTDHQLHKKNENERSNGVKNAGETENDALRSKVAKRLGLTPFLRAVLLDGEFSKNKALIQPPLNTVVYESFLFARDNLSIGKGTVIEHSFFLEQLGSISIGDDCLVSGLRSKGTKIMEQPVDKSMKQPVDKCSATGGLTIPSGFLVQEVPLAAFGDSVYMVLGIDDDIKSCPCNSIYGRPLQEFLNWSGLDEKDIWPEEGKTHDLWNARIHAVCHGNESNDESSYMSLFSWLQSFCSEERTNSAADEDTIVSLARWRVRRRLSLAEIRERAHAPTEFDFRSWVCTLCEKSDNNGKEALLSMARAFQGQMDLLFRLRHVLLTRQHEYIDIHSLIYSAHDGKADVAAGIAALRTLDEVIGQSFREEQFDISGRAWMLSDDLLTTLQDSVGFIVDPFEEQAMEERVMECLVRVSRHRRDVGFKNMFLDELELFAANAYRKLQRQSSSASDAEDYALLRNTLLRVFPSLLVQEGFRDLSEKYAQAMTRLCVMGRSTLQTHRPSFGTLTLDRWILACAPARVDLAGGWSDTPPICFEFGSHVTGLAVSIDGKKPLSCRARLVKNADRILLRTEHRDKSGRLLSAEQIEVYKLYQMEGYNDPSSKCALLKCALVVLGLVSVEEITDSNAQLLSIGSILAKRCHTTGHLGMEVVVCSMLPHGSGMGSSSIIAGCILASIGKCLGLDFSTSSNTTGLDLIDRITVLEQELTSGGGFQDQVHGLFGGAKTVSCEPRSPLSLAVNPIQLNSEFQRTLDENLILVFTGQTRLAKDILRTCLRRWASRNPTIVENVKDLVRGSHAARDALLSSSLRELGAIFNQYWQQKKIMAGKDSGVEPPLVARICEELIASELVYGASLCGAGGGGFLALIKSENITLSQLEASILEITGTDSGVSLHMSAISKDGLTITSLPESIAEIDHFDTTWMNA